MRKAFFEGATSIMRCLNHSAAVRGADGYSNTLQLMLPRAPVLCIALRERLASIGQVRPSTHARPRGVAWPVHAGVEHRLAGQAGRVVQPHAQKQRASKKHEARARSLAAAAAARHPSVRPPRVWALAPLRLVLPRPCVGGAPECALSARLCLSVSLAALPRRMPRGRWSWGITRFTRTAPG